MKGNKGKEVAGEGDRPEAGDARPEIHPRLVRLLGTRGSPYQKIWIWEVSSAVVTRGLSMCRPR